mmetsp:Transcript_19664/g.51155  ORF Transcript_19664/g.51155 Transcript_19664/m.51155 type:complete len:378 (-) Transcript_19664:1305-2438(-)
MVVLRSIFGAVVLHLLHPPALARAEVTVTVDNGFVGSKYVGTFTSQLTTTVLPMFPAVNKTDWEGVSLINSSTLRYLRLIGEYQCDTPLRLPSLLILQLNGTMTPAANLSLEAVPRFTGMVTMNGTFYSGIMGGTFDATGLRQVNGSRGHQAITIVNGAHNVVRSVRAIANNTDSAIGVNESPFAEIAFCDVGGSEAATALGRCIWTLATSHAIVHHNHIHHCSAHALDFDAFTGNSAAYGNLCEDNGEEGIFVEETAHDNFVFNNTLRRNRCGIGLYANAVGPVQSNWIVGNVLDSNENGLTSGGYGHLPGKYAMGNIFASNVLTNNAPGGAQVDVSHGQVIGDVWIDNTFSGPEQSWSRVPTGPTANGNVSIFAP